VTPSGQESRRHSAHKEDSRERHWVLLDSDSDRQSQ
jgi:hypothetical protein